MQEAKKLKVVPLPADGRIMISSESVGTALSGGFALFLSNSKRGNLRVNPDTDWAKKKDSQRSPRSQPMHVFRAMSL